MSSSASVECQICFKYGHTAAVCDHRFDQNFAPNQSNSQPSNQSYPQNLRQNQSQFSMANSPYPEQFNLHPQFQFQQIDFRPSSPQADSGSTDSGPTHHVTPALQNIDHQLGPFDFEGRHEKMFNFSSRFNPPPPFPFDNIRREKKATREDMTTKLVVKKLKRLPESTSETDVTFSIAKSLFLKDSKDKNIVFSPLSLQVVLSMVAAGSDGATLDELLSFLGSNSADQLNSLASKLVSNVLSDASSTGGPHLCFTNGVWVEQSLPVHHSFKQVMNTDYKATLASVDFWTKAGEVISEVNSWAEAKTKGLIKNLLPDGSVDHLTRLILTNALYFKGAWHDKFESSMTKDGDFHILNGTSIKVPFMVSKMKQFINVFDTFKVLGLPYKRGEDQRQFSMYFLLPHAKNGLSALVELVASTPGFLKCNLPNHKVEVGDFRIPKFKISFDFEASDVLKELGVVLPFSDNADLSKMAGSPGSRGLYVSNIFHKSCIEINEEGSEATAVSTARVRTKGLPIRVDFVADRPFIFLIREDSSETILFIGQVLNPLVG
ncbi:serpin-ZX-like [Lotus japonicus]|uniref:serpin-ZX-like n=1 Tax=Lotus japonicus TaxID=34305 RepID=UPI002590EA4B|nr:serpin-ZX-like [Lotus japonicus]